MAWKKSSPELIERFKGALPKHPDAQPRQMFGYPCCFVKGNFFVGMHEDNMVVRLPGDLKSKFAALKTAKGFDPMANGKGMKDWWVIPKPVVEDDQRLGEFFAAAFAEVQNLPAKAARAKKKTKKS